MKTILVQFGDSEGSRLCKKRMQPVFNRFQSIEGDPFKPWVTPIRVGDIDMEKGPGSTLMCTSMCPEEDITQCMNDLKLNKKLPQGVCKGDSGGISPNYTSATIYMMKINTKGIFGQFILINS